MFPARNVVRRDAPQKTKVASQAPRDDDPGASERRPAGRFSRSLGGSRTLADAPTSPPRSLLLRKREKRSYVQPNHDRGH